MPPAQRGTTAAAVFSAGNVANPTNLNPALSTGYEIGDTLLCFTACRSPTPTVATPTANGGWTSLLNVTGTNGRLVLFGIIATSTSMTAPTVTWSGLTTGTGSTTPVGAQCAAFSGMRPTTTGMVDILGAVENAVASTGSSAAGADIVTTKANDLVLSLTTRLDDAGTRTAPGTFTAVGSAGTTSGIDFALAWAFNVRASAGSATVADWSLSGASSFASSGVQVALKPSVVYTDSQPGGIVASGSGTDAWSKVSTDSGSGDIIASGTGDEEYIPGLTPYDLVIDEDDPISHYKMGDADLDVAVDRKGVQDLDVEIVAGEITAVAGLVENNGDNQATHMDGFARYFASTPLAAYESATWSIEAWFKYSVLDNSSIVTLSAPSLVNHAALRCSGFEGVLSICTNNPTIFGGDTFVTTVPSVIQVDELYHVVGVCDGDDLLLYINGSLYGSEPADGIAKQGTIEIAGPSGFNGAIDEVAWYNSALSAERVIAHYEAGGGVVDVVAPVPNVTSVDVSRISRVSGKDVVTIDFSADENFIEYELRRVTSSSDSRAAGNQVETATVGARSSHIITVTDDELVAASASEGTNLLKLFVKDISGNWST